MKKILVFICILIIAVAVVGPKVVGSQFANGIENTVSAINKNPAYSASIKQLQSTWFSTNAQVVVSLNLPEINTETPLDFSLTVNIDAKHGPIIINDGFAIAWLHTDLQTQESVLPNGLTLANGSPLYQFNGLTGLWGTTVYKDSVAAMHYIDPETQGLISFTGLHGNGEISANSLQYYAISESINMNVEEMFNFEMQNFVLNIESAESLAGMLTKGLYDSSVNVSTSLIRFTNLLENTEVRVVDTKFIGLSDYNEKTDLGDLTMTTSVASVDASDMQLADLNSVIEIKRIQGKFFQAYQKLANDMANNMANPDQVQNNVKVFIDTYLLAQLQAKPEYNFSNISGKINGSEFNAKIMTSLGEVTSLPSSLEDTNFWMQHMLVDSKIVMQKGAAEFIATTIVSRQLLANPNFAALSVEEQAEIISEQVQATIDGVVKQGMVDLNGENYGILFTLNKGVAMLNGNQIPL